MREEIEVPDKWVWCAMAGKSLRPVSGWRIWLGDGVDINSLRAMGVGWNRGGKNRSA